MTGDPQDGAPHGGDRGRRVVRLHELLEATGSGAPDRVADLGAADRAADEHAIADLSGAGLARADPAGPDATGPGARADPAGPDPAGAGPSGPDRPGPDSGGVDSGGAGADRGAGESTDQGGNPAAAVAALDGVAVGRDAGPVAGLDGAGLGGAAAATRTVDLGAAGARKRRRAPGTADSDPADSDPADRVRERRGPAGRKRPTDRGATVGGATVGGATGGGAARSDEGSGDDLDRGGEAPGAEPPAAGRPTRGRWGNRGAGAKRGGSAATGPDVDPVVAAREICLRLLTDRARTRHELAQALSRKEIPDDVAEQVLGRFDEVGLIDDAAFAGQWVRSRHRSKGLGRRAIAQELRQKGVDAEIAGEALAEVDGESEERRARELVDRKLRSMRVGSADDRVVAARRLVGMLARKGYGGGLAYGVVRTALAEHGADTEEFDGGEPPAGD
jgi:regulatory protein